MKKNDALMEIEMGEGTKTHMEGKIRFSVEKMQEIFSRVDSSYGRAARVKILHREIMSDFSDFLYHYLGKE